MSELRLTNVWAAIFLKIHLNCTNPSTKLHKWMTGIHVFRFLDSHLVELHFGNLLYVMSCRIRVRFYRRCLSTFEIIIKAFNTTKRCLAIDLQNVRCPHYKSDLEHVAYRRSKFKISDTLTNIKTIGMLLTSMESSVFDHQV